MHPIEKINNTHIFRAIGINITSSILFLTPAPAGYGFAPLSVGYIYFTPIVGALLGEFFGHFFNDYVAKRYVRTHAGVFHPEARLIATYVSAALMIPGLVAVGQALGFHESVGIVIIGWGWWFHLSCVISFFITETTYFSLFATGGIFTF